MVLDKQRLALLQSTEVGEINIRSVVKEMLRKKTSRREQCQGAIYFPCAHVSTQCCVCHTWSSHLLQSAVPWPVWRRLLSALLTKHTADVHCGGAKHPPPVFAPVPCPLYMCSSSSEPTGGGTGFEQRMIWPSRLRERLGRDQFEGCSPALLRNPTEHPERCPDGRRVSEPAATVWQWWGFNYSCEIVKRLCLFSSEVNTNQP